MQYFKLLALLIVTSCLFYSCCVSVDCGGGSPYCQFRIINTNDGTDMVFGPTKVYDKHEIKFYSVTLNDTTIFNYLIEANYNNDSTLYDSTLLVYFTPKTDIVYMRLSDVEVDTLEFSHVENNSKCCGSITEIVGLRLNNSTDIEPVNGNGIMEIRK